jgi:hypothetical protein
LNYDIEVATGAKGYYYVVTLHYTDEKDNQIVGDPEKCVDWRIY